jgi:DNA-binding response OmpR family regulator
MEQAAAARPRVILVEDDRETREMLVDILEYEGYAVTQVANGLRLISTLHVDQPDLIILDVNLSWIDGFELCRAVKQNDEYGRIPIVFLSGRTSPADVQRGMEAGAEAYLHKPVDLAQLLGTLRKLVGKKGGETP